jgi:hypothetical protein
MEQSVADRLRLGLFESAVDAGHLRPGDKRPGDETGGHPGEVLGEARERQILEPAVFPAPDTVLDAGMAAVAALERRRVDLKGIRVRDETRVPKPSEVSNRLSWAPG